MPSSRFSWPATDREGDVSNLGVEFDQGETQPPVATTTQTAPKGHPSDDHFEWPLYGYTKSRTHVIDFTEQLRPPFRRAWATRGDALLEFTPVLCKRSLLPAQGRRSAR